MTATDFVGSADLEREASLANKLALDFEAWARRLGRNLTAGLCLRLIFLEPGFQLVLTVRLEEFFGRVPVVGKLARRLTWFATYFIFGCQIDPQARIGGGLYLPHPIGIVIGNEISIGRNVMILHHTTLGRRGDGSSVGPTVGDGAEIYSGAVVVGPITIGPGARVGANAVVLTDVPAGKTAVGIPASVVRSNVEGDLL